MPSYFNQKRYLRLTKHAATALLCLSLASCGIQDEIKNTTKEVMKEISKAAPIEHLDITIQTLYALREGNTAKAIEAQEELLAMQVALTLMNPDLKLDPEQEKTIRLAKAYLELHPPKQASK